MGEHRRRSSAARLAGAALGGFVLVAACGWLVQAAVEPVPASSPVAAPARPAVTPVPAPEPAPTLEPAPTPEPAADTPTAEAAGLPASTTFTTIDGAPPDPDPTAATDGTVVHPLRATAVHDAPGGTPIATMATEQFGDTWLPVIGERDGWVQVLLPSRPARSSGWIRAADVERAVTPYVIEVHLGSRTMELRSGGAAVGTWSVGVGAPGTPTPVGRTFVLGAFRNAEQDYSPLFFPLGTHSPTLDSFGGGPGTVAFHGWPTGDTFGAATSNGCIRVPADALRALTAVPVGTLVLIDEA
ncbi:L,D-transpeptidase family protein [Pseudonocardia sp.]|uniref:L,D-transpeptidase n=1 Tax=Pseudonocardia sp. TaxID=60912 RepID=UPI002628C9C2|nr:L,D-transpeptidase family protein [Pseudonocardia sp.]